MSSSPASSEQGLLNDNRDSIIHQPEPHTNIEDTPMADNISITSTIEYRTSNHESFTTYKAKILQVATKYFKRGEKDIKIEHMKGGSSNRVAAISVRKPPRKLTFRWLTTQLAGCIRRTQDTPSNLDEFIIRVPRGSSEKDISGDLALTKVVGAHVKLPVPEVIAHDLSADNVLKNPYMIQKRLKGENLCRLWSSLNTRQQVSFVKQYAKLTPAIAASLHGPPGVISPNNLAQPDGEPVIVDKYFLGSDSQPIPESADQTPVGHLLELVERFRGNWGERFPRYFDSLANLTKALDARGFLSGPCVLVHGDLEAYNLLVSVVSDTEVSITGVLDWDLAFMAPEVFAYKIPSWLWAEKPDITDADRLENLSPDDTDEDRMFNQAFLNSITPEQHRLYFSTEAIIARRALFVFKEGLFTTYHHQELQKCLGAWSRLHPEDGVQAVEYFDEHGDRIWSDDEDDEDDDNGSDDDADSTCCDDAGRHESIAGGEPGVDNTCVGEAK